jgi:hypothetical protein
LNTHLVDLSVDAAVEFSGEPMFEAVRIEDTAFEAALSMPSGMCSRKYGKKRF